MNTKQIAQKPVRASATNRRRGAESVGPVKMASGQLVLLVISILFLFPIAWMVSASFTPSEEIFSSGLRFFPANPTLENYQTAFTSLPLLRNLGNSVIIAGVYTVGALFLCSLAAFAFAKFNFPGRNVLFTILLGTMMVPALMTLLPSFIIMSNLQWVNTYQSVIVPGLANAFGIFFMRQYMIGIPDELIDAARVDGAGSFRIFWRIMLPLCRPALAVLAIMQVISQWNQFLWPLIMLRDNSMYTIVLAVAALPSSNFNTPWGVVMVGGTVAVLPLIITFLIMQRGIIAGIMAGGLKG
ncbi:MAG: carbohydrate transporter permease [Propionibacteriaceae bacterium]|jgi:multiple sugar transport system permease protein|nr:carbohydrate transporter permease [Propionibacteriaceae bacterium]